MARMIPPTIDPDTVSRGEIEVFKKLKKDRRTRNWIVLHSLDLAQHLKLGTGEIDFVAIIPKKGILFVEVKGVSRFQCRDGRWRFGAERGWHSRSPFAQAKEAKFSILHWLESGPHRDLSRLFMWHAVIFPFAPFKTRRSPEWHDWELIDKPMYEKGKIGRLLENVLENAWKHFSKKQEAKNFRRPGPEECERLAGVLRPRFEFYLSPKEETRQADRDLKNYTEEQYRALDALEFNQRVLFDGPSGTGKTVLAIESVRRAVSEGKRVLLLCHARNLGEWFKKQVAPLDPWVWAGSIFELISEIGGEEKLSMRERAATAVEKLKRQGNGSHLYDLAVVDEGQDIIVKDYMLEFLDAVIVGGLAEGSWRIFADTRTKNFGGPATLELLEELSPGFTKYALRVNCRNNPAIAALANSFIGMEKAYDEIKRSEEERLPEPSFYRDENHQLAELDRTLAQLTEDGFDGRQIVVLSLKSIRESAAFRLSQTERWKDKLKPFPPDSRRDISYCSVWDFRGLEKGIVLITDIDRPPDPNVMNLLYVGASRALHRLYLFVSSSVESDYRGFFRN